MFAPFYTWYTGEADPAVADGSDVAGLKMNYGIGLINTGLKGDGSSINYPNGIVGVDGLTDNDYFILYVVSDYGSSSAHPIYPVGTTPADGRAMYKAGNIGDGTNVGSTYYLDRRTNNGLVVLVGHNSTSHLGLCQGQSYKQEKAG